MNEKALAAIAPEKDVGGPLLRIAGWSWAIACIL